MSKKYIYVKKRYWAFVIYPDSLPLNWLEILQETGAPVAISPLHDKDINSDNSKKKPHYHCIICYQGPATLNTVKRVTDSLNAPIPIPLENIKGYYRYFTHKDNPEKAQYNDNDIRYLNGFSISDFVELTSSDKLEMIRKVTNIILEHNITEYVDLIEYLYQIDNKEYISIATYNAFYFTMVIKSLRHKQQKGD